MKIRFQNLHSAILVATVLALALLAAGCGFASHEAPAAPASDAAPAAPAGGPHGEHAPAHSQPGKAHAARDHGAFGHNGDPRAKIAETVEPRQASESGAVSGTNGEVTFTGSREETAQLILHFQSIRLTPDQERTKVAALATIPAPCCDDNPLATCCCPCNMGKAVWGLAAWLITDRGYGVEEVRKATLDWLQAANPDGFAGNACYTPGGCARPIHRDGCGGMDDRRVL